MADLSSERENCVFVAKLAEETKRFDEMVERMEHVAKMGEELTQEERELLFAGYWNVTVRKRDAWEVFARCGLEEEEEGNDKIVKHINEYKQKLGAQIINICIKVLSIIDEYLIPTISTPDAYMFYHKMKGDYNRYLAEFKTGKDKQEAADEAIKAYEAARSTAVAVLPPGHYFRLGLDLNLSVFYHVILDKPERAIEIATQAIHEAKPALDELSEEVYKKSFKMIHLLKNNIELWKPDK